VISAWISSFFSMRSMRARSTLRILPRIGRIAWKLRVARPFAGRRRVALTMNSSLSAFFDEQSRACPACERLDQRTCAA
jgi:hypothetical protein